MMRSFGSRADTFVSDEPFYGCFLKTSGADHPDERPPAARDDDLMAGRGSFHPVAKRSRNSWAPISTALTSGVELTGLEPVAFWVPPRRSPN